MPEPADLPSDPYLFLPDPAFPPAEETAEPVLDQPEHASVLPAPRGPGLLEAAAWIIGFFVLEICGSIAFGIVFGLAITAFKIAAGQERPTVQTVQAAVEGLLPAILGGVKFLEVVVLLAAMRLRFGRHAFRVMGFGSPHVLHAAVLGIAVVPAAYLSSQCYAALQIGWTRLEQAAPALQELDKLSSIPQVQAMAATTPLWALVLAIAVGPALTEEFLCRAILGRGLLARYGLAGGIALTSLIFAAMHMAPVHAAALLPLAVLMHVGYYASGSIWVPVGVHLANNAMSVALMKYALSLPKDDPLAQQAADASFSPLLFAASAACVAATVWLLMQLRVRWRLPDGREWTPDFPSVEPPPPWLGAERFLASPAVGPVVATVLSYVAFPVALVVAARMQQAS